MTVLLATMPYPTMQPRPMRCNRQRLSDLLLQQWKRLTQTDLEKVRYSKREIALLIEQEYGVHHLIAESYLTNLERSLPMSA